MAKFKPDKKYEAKEKMFQKEGNKAYLNHEKAEIKATEKNMKKKDGKDGKKKVDGKKDGHKKDGMKKDDKGKDGCK